MTKNIGFIHGNANTDSFIFLFVHLATRTIFIANVRLTKLLPMLKLSNDARMNERSYLEIKITEAGRNWLGK